MLSVFLNNSTNVLGKTLFICRSLNQTLIHTVAFCPDLETPSALSFHPHQNGNKEKYGLLETADLRHYQIYISNAGANQPKRSGVRQARITAEKFQTQ